MTPLAWWILAGFAWLVLMSVVLAFLEGAAILRDAKNDFESANAGALGPANGRRNAAEAKSMG